MSNTINDSARPDTLPAPETLPAAQPQPMPAPEDGKPLASAPRKFTAPRKKRRWPVRVAVVLLLIGAGVAAWWFFGRTTAQAAVNLVSATVDRGDIKSTISGSGSVQPLAQYDISAMVKGEILEDYVQIGAKVEKGDLMYVVDNSDALKSIEKSELSLRKQEMSYGDTVSALSDLTVYAPIGGRIETMYVQNGDEINSGSKLADIVDSSTMRLKLPFHAADAALLHEGMSAQVTLSSGEALNGTVVHVSSGSYASSAGAPVCDIEIEFTNPGGVAAGGKATAVVGGYACSDEGDIEVSDTRTVMAKASGTVSGLNYKQGDTISSGRVLLYIDSPNTDRNIENGALSLEEARMALEDAKSALDDYNISSPIAGTIVKKDWKAGDKLESGKTALAVVADMSKLTFTLNVDELDIQSIAVGQQVDITADALPGQVFEGVIDSISILGASQNGVTTYPVTVIIEEYGSLLPGMNVSAEVVSQQSTNALRLPVSALQRGNLVMVRDDSAAAARARALSGGTDGAAGSDTPTGGDMQGGGTLPEGMTTPDGAAFPDGATPPDGMTRPAGMGGGATASGQSAGGERPDAVELSAQSFSMSYGTGGGAVISDGPGGDASDAARRGSFSMGVVGGIVEADAPEGYVYILVSVGLSSDSYVEITGGLEEGDVVYYEPATYDGSNMFGSFGGMGGMGMGMQSAGRSENVVIARG